MRARGTLSAMSCSSKHRPLFNRPLFIEPQTGRTRSTVSSAPDVVGVFGNAELTVGRVLLFVVLAACEPTPPPKPAPDAGAPSVSAASASATVRPRSCKAECQLAGLCAWDAERARCIAESTDKCAASNSCKTSGLCEKDNTVCIGTKPAHCAASERCKSEGLCTFVAKGIFPCQAGEKDCAASDACRRKGHCTAVRGTCRITGDADCARAEACTRHGLCSAKSSGDTHTVTCVALTNEDCAKGTDCTEGGQCTAAAGYCR